jgi:hypothetical protein
VEPGPTTFDRDLDLLPRLSVPEPIEPVDLYQRLVANPFLAVLCWLAAFGLLRESMRRENLALLMTGITLLFLAFFFLQFHCLDCGATGWLLRSWAHRCPAVVARQRSRMVRRIHGPGLKIQLAAWFIIITAAFVLGMVALQSQR